MHGYNNIQPARELQLCYNRVIQFVNKLSHRKVIYKKIISIFHRFSKRSTESFQFPQFSLTKMYQYFHRINIQFFYQHPLPQNSVPQKRYSFDVAIDSTTEEQGRARGNKIGKKINAMINTVDCS